MQVNLGVDSWIVEAAQRSEGAMIVDGHTPDGVPLLVVVMTGANVGIFKREAVNVLPGLANCGKNRQDD